MAFSDLPSVRPGELVRALEKAGFVVTRQTGSHLFLVNREVRRATVVAMHNRDVTKAMLQAVIQQAGLSAEELVRLLAH